MKIYHNPRCRKSRETLSILEENGIKPDIILYLNDTPSKQELKGVLEKLGMRASEIIRKGEQIYKDNFKGKDLSEDEWLNALVEYPKLIERPIVVKGEKAVLGRPPQNVLELI
ncbi:MAG: arsenate reductase (glutaredoxin) [Bacteroidetes bacterium]|nr:MAG: arsenate reductase (glutaredoxin) [Bacteroidota bacterium]